MSELKRYNLEEIRNAIGVLFQPGQVVEVRMMNTKKKLTVAGWYDDLDIMATHVAKLATVGFGNPVSYRHVQENIYWTINPVHDGLLARQPKNTIQWAEGTTSDINITHRNWIPVDIDPIRPSGIGSTAGEKKLARDVTLALGQKLLDLGFPENCMVAGLSGNGYHLPIRIDLPNDKESLDLVKNCLAALQFLAGTNDVDIDQKVCNAGRILKCYGTMSCKGENTEDRPWRLAKLLTVPDNIQPVSRDLLEKLAALAPVKGKRREGEKRAGPWTEENTQEYLEWTGWECADPVDYNNGRKWVGICLNNDAHKDAAVILTDGWWNYTCYHAGCKEMTNDEFKVYWEEQNDDKYPYPKQKMARATAFEFDDLEPDKLSAKPVDTTGLKVRARSVSDPPAVVTDAKAASPVEDPKVAYKKANGDLARQIDAIMNPEVEKGERMPPERERMRGASLLIAKHLKTTGKLYNCGNVATYVDNYTHELIEITKGSPKFTRKMMNFGIGPEKLLDYFGRWMGAVATDSPENQVYAMSYYHKNDRTDFLYQVEC